jgi:hypothetical protein
MAQARSPQVFLALVNGVPDGRVGERPSRFVQANVIHPSGPLRVPAPRSRHEFREAVGRREKSGPAEARPPQRRQVANVVTHQTADPVRPLARRFSR